MEDTPSGNAEAFTQRLVAMRPKLHRYCARMTGSVIDGEDAVQEAMIKAIEAFPGQRSIDNVDAWVFRIAHNCALDLLRRRSRSPGWASEAAIEAVADPRADSEHRLAAAAGLRTFMQLPPGPRAAVILMDVLGYSLQEIGAVLEASPATVKAALHRGRMRLRELAATDEAAPLPPLLPREIGQLAAYIERFNAHDFDAIRAMLAEDVRLDLVNRQQASGRAAVSRYFGNYAGAADWRLNAGLVEGRPAILVADATGAIAYFVIIEWRGAAIARILDFRYARYVMETAEMSA